MNVESTMGISGTYELIVRRPDGSVRERMGPFKNMITNFGLDEYTRFDYPSTNAVVIGTGTAPALATDEYLGNLVSRADPATNPKATGQSIQPTAPGRWVSWSRTWGFNVDQYIGTITEVGMEAWSQSFTPRKLFSRALLPAPLSLIAGDQLEVTYRVYHHLPDDDITKVITVNGVDYTVTCRAIVLSATSIDNSDSFQYPYYGWRGVFGTTRPCKALETDVLYAATSALPGGGSDSTTRSETSVPGSFELFRLYNWNIGAGNFPTGIGLIIMQSTNSSGSYQFKFSPKLPKNNTNMLTFKMKCKFTRGTPPP